ncbi:MAG TPA: sugar ABC transporter permease [Spirochaetia bacterium]|nr:sugar ABC transporter permease [Spirochaetia bacterium]
MKNSVNGRSKSLRRTQRYRLLFLLPVLLDVILVFIYPLFNNVRMGFQHYTIASFVNGTAPYIGMKNYVEVFSNPLMGKTVLNTLIFTVGSIVFQFAIGLLLALFFKLRFSLSQLMRTLILIPWLLPLIVSATAFRWMFDHTNGIINQFLLNLHLITQPMPWLITPHLALLTVIIANIWIGIPFNMVLLYGGLMSIPDEFYEAASIDGANAVQSFWHITIPALREVILIVLMLGLIYTLKVFDVIRVLTGGGPANSTQILSTWSYSLSFTDLSFGQGAAVGNVLMLITLVFAAIYIRAIRSSLSSSR